MRNTLFALAALLFAFDASAAAPRAKVRIALIVESTVDDKGWCQSMHDAITAVQKKYGPAAVEYSYSEKMKPVDAGSAARQYASKGFDIVICHGAQYKNLVLEMADEFPKTTFAFGTSAEVGPKNVFTYMPQSEETGYLNGLIAGLATKANVVGVVGPVDGGDAARYDRGFVLGVRAVNPKAEVKVAHTGSFGDFVKASELAHTQVKAGADVLTGSSQQALGALRAVATYHDKPIWWLGQDVAQLATPERSKVVAACSYDYVPVIETLVAKRQAGVLGGENLPLNFKNGGFVFKYNDAVGPVLTKEIRGKVDAARASLAAGKLPLDWKSVKF
ncbi:BMP family lipoprotein [Anaeromyxobacter diazotrophicus]|uniref:ABC transporter substrate-binding protein n=1 Tax=Anaeromyxobacter diazotrophicus TaxID=2590199 RepID=A0A7I9VSL0_9BACT|nr:BMP family ABC transporter substrate-binding protein [Anaeromyxobacter diazotrophicus]GEJ58917.1 ABC transporter substrate-binding protein [Anaeromyxobacter diazotrophicus]